MKTSNNLLPVHAHAVSWAAHNLSEKMLDKIFILYPNPNPKVQDLNKRWHALPFFGFLVDLLKPDGMIVMRTNEEFYALEACDFMKKYWGLSIKHEQVSFKDKVNPETLFEKNILSEGRYVMK